MLHAPATRFSHGHPMTRTRKHRGGQAAAVAAGLVAAFGLAAMRGPSAPSAAAEPAYAATVTNCRVIDGDTLHCDGGRIRLLGIDAPELPGHCSANRDCAPGDPFASTASLKQGLGDDASIRIERVGTDRYGRTLAMVLGRGGDLSCWQLARGQAIYKPRWDNGGRIARACGL